jgi:hypothetical protein
VTAAMEHDDFERVYRRNGLGQLVTDLFIIEPKVHPRGWPVNRHTYKRTGCRCDGCSADYAAQERVYRNRRHVCAPPLLSPPRPRKSLKYRPDGTAYNDPWPGRP